MAAPRFTHKLPRGLGRLIRTSPNAPWLWQRWEKRAKKWIVTPTRQTNRSLAEQFVYQQRLLDNGSLVAMKDAPVLFAHVAERYLENRKNGIDAKKLRRSSLRKLGTGLKAFQKFMGDRYASLQVRHVDSELLKRFAADQAERMCPSVANLNLNMIVQVLRFAAKKRIIPAVPEVERIPDNGDHNGNDDGLTGSAVPTAAEVRQIIENARVEMKPTGKVTRHGRPIYEHINENDYADFLTALSLTGMRIGEACHLTWNDVDLESKVILIRPGLKGGRFWQPKSQASIRRIAIVPALEPILLRLRKANPKSTWVFVTHRGSRVHECNVQKRFREICDDLKFEKRFTVHSLRKFWASAAAMSGMDAKVMIKMLGHTDFELILKTYFAQNDDARLLEEASKIDFVIATSCEPMPRACTQV